MPRLLEQYQVHDVSRTLLLSRRRSEFTAALNLLLDHFVERLVLFALYSLHSHFEDMLSMSCFKIRLRGLRNRPRPLRVAEAVPLNDTLDT